MSHLENGSVVWVRLGQAWWPGTITTIAKCPPEFVQAIRKTPIAIVKFFHENEYQDVHKAEHIFPYNCDRKEEFIRKGQVVNKNQSHGDVDLLAKFEADVVTAEKLTGGDMDILRTLVEGAGKRRIDYSDLGFGPPKPKKKREDGVNRQGSDIGQAVVYKRLGGRGGGGGRGGHRVVVEHRVRIMEQPRRENMEDEMRAAASWYKCQQCGFTCTRLNVIVWHNKAHLSKVCNYDSGIKLPGRRRRRPGASRGGRDARKKGKERKGKENLDHAHTNGDVTGGVGGGKKELQDTQQILMDWDDEDDAAPVGGEPGTPQSPENKGEESDGGYSDADDDYPPPQPKYERRPMPKAADLNSAFDALLAATHTHPNLNTSSSSGPTNNYINNDSDSDYSDWEKYYARDSGSGSEEEEEVEQESDIKSLCEGNAGEGGAEAPGEEEGVEEEGGNMSHSHVEEPQKEQEEEEHEKMEAASSPRPVSADRVSPPPKDPVCPCPDLTPEPEPDQQQEECAQPDAEDPENLGEPPEEAVEVEEVAENMEMEEGLSNPPDYCEEEVAREPSQNEEELAMATEEVEYYEESEKNSNEALQLRAHPEVTQQPEDLEVARDCTDPCQDDVQDLDSSPVARAERGEQEHPTASHPSSRESDGEQPENMNRLSRYIDEFSETMVAKEEEVSVGTEVYSEGHRQSLEASSSPRPLHPGQDGPVSASPARSGDLATTSNSGTTYMLVAVDAHGNTVPTVPTPALSEGGNDLVAVEATMEDGTTRTLYIDPAQLGPNVDLNNLMLHIDTTGQEHVIIPSSSSSDSEGPPSRPAPPIHYSAGQSYVHGDYESASSPPESSHCHAQHHGDNTYKAFHPTHCPPTSPRLDSNNMVISGQPSQPPLASPCPAGVEFESRPQENLWPERVEAHTRLGCNTSKVRNPQNCQAASSDHQIAVLSRNSPSSTAAIAGRDTNQAHPCLGGTSVVTKHCSDNKMKEEWSAGHRQKAGISHNVTVSVKEQVTRNYITIPVTRVTLLEARSEGKLLEEDEDEEEEEEEEEEEDSLNNELNSESEKLVESVDEDSLNLELEMEAEEDEPEPQRPVLEGEGEALESDSDSDFFFEIEDEEDGSLALLGPEQESLADENEDSLIPDFEIASEEEDEEVSERVDQHHLSQSWETDDSEEELYHNLPSASATDEEDVGWMQSGIEVQNKGHHQMQAPNPTQLKGVAGTGRNSIKGVVEKEEPPREKAALCQEEKREESCPRERAQGMITKSSLQKSSIPSQATTLEPLIQETCFIHHRRRGQNLEEEKNPKEEEDEDPFDHQSLPNLPLTCSKTSHCQDMRPSQESMSCQDSKEPVILDLSALDSPSTSKLPDNSLTFEGFDWEKTKQASARLLMLMKVRQLHPQHRTQGWKAKTVSRRGRPPLKGRIGDLQGKRAGSVSLRRKRNQWCGSSTTPMTSDTDEEQEEELESGCQRSVRGRGSRGGTGFRKHRYARGRPSNRKLRHSPLRRKTLHKQHNSTERSVEKRKTRSSDKEREKETTKTTRKTRDSYERFTHSPDITSYSEAQPRQPRTWGGTREKENRSGQCAAPGDPPVKRTRKRKPSEVDNLLKWAVETGHTGSRNRGLRERHHSPTTVGITSSSTTNNNNNNNNARRSRLEAKTANKIQKKRGRKRKVRRDTEEEKDEELEGQAHTHSSSDDPLVNSEEELSDIGKTTVSKGRPVYPYKSGDLVWVQLEGHWWPAYVDQVYPQTRRVSVYRVGLKQEASSKVDLARVRSFQYGDVPAFVDRSESGFTEALQVTESFCLLRNHGNKISSHKFFTMPPEEQDALIIVSFTPKDDPALASPEGKRTRGQTREEQQPMAHKGWYYESLNSDSEDGIGARGEDKYMSARDRRRMQKALRSRRRENEKLIKYMKSAVCMEHLWQIFSGQKQCERHKLYQSEATRRSLLWSGIGPFQLDQDDDQILSVVDFLHTEMNKKQPDFNLAQDYVFKVWMPEAIKEALRMVFKVPEDMLELALDEGYRENLTGRKTRRLDFV